MTTDGFPSAPPCRIDVACGRWSCGDRHVSGCVRGRSSVVERQLPKLYVVGSIPIARSKLRLIPAPIDGAHCGPQDRIAVADKAVSAITTRRWRSVSHESDDYSTLPE